MVFNATFDDSSTISWRSVLLVNENRSTRRKPPTCRKPLTNVIMKCCMEYNSPCAGFDFIKLVVISTDYIGSCKSNYYIITTTTAATLLINISHQKMLQLIFYLYLVLMMGCVYLRRSIDAPVDRIVPTVIFYCSGYTACVFSLK